MPSDAFEQPPGAPPRGPAEQAALVQTLAAKGADHAPRTHLLREDGRPRHLNRLIRETSPYLLQHAHNPVDWRPWGAEAMAEAAARDLPIFFSAGYATCHWCHVMEEESFDDEQVAARLNASCVPVKLDREERPDIDQLYMLASMMVQQRGGWPNSIWMTPDGRPFFAGSYFPKDVFLRAIDAVGEAWRARRSELEAQATQIAEAIRAYSAAEHEAARIGSGEHAQALADLAGLHNPEHGGFSAQTQFPNEVFLLYLLDQWRRHDLTEALAMARLTLDRIVAGGIHDHVGGGFHRYSVDVNWRTPHFEKMLYNQALLGQALVELWEATAAPRYRRAAERCFDYVIRDMTDAEGAFFAAEDADSPRPDGGGQEEGAFYAWTAEQARAALGEEAGAAIAALGLAQPETIEAGPVAHLDPEAETDFAALDPMLERLREARAARPRPIRDAKIIAGWNGLMIRAMADGGAAFGVPRYVAAAARAAEAVWSALWRDDRLRRLSADGAVSPIAGGLDDCAWLGLGFLALWDATGEARHRERAELLASAIVRDFGASGGRLSMAVEDGPLGPVLETDDGATPAGESSSLELFARLAARRRDAAWREGALQLLGALSGRIANQPLARVAALRAAAELQGGETGARRPLAGGAVRARLSRDGDRARLTLDIAEGWRIVGPAEQGELAAMSLSGEGVGAVDWPPTEPVAAAFRPAPIQAYRGDAAIGIALTGPTATIDVSLQACSEELCLAVETASFRLARP